MTDKKPRGNSANLRPPWKPGQSGNPSGRPKRRPITESYIEMADQELPPEMCQRLGMKPGSTFAHAVARGQFINAIKGDVKNANEIRQAIEGNPNQRVKQEPVHRKTLEELLEESHHGD